MSPYEIPGGVPFWLMVEEADALGLGHVVRPEIRAAYEDWKTSRGTPVDGSEAASVRPCQTPGAGSRPLDERDGHA